MTGGSDTEPLEVLSLDGSLLVSITWPGPTLAGTQTSVASESLRCRVK